MTNTTNVDDRSPIGYAVHLLQVAWRNLVSIYCLNTPIWRYLKSGALLWFGLMLWAFSNLVLSYKPDWWFVYYAMAYGFVLIVWGPLTHMVVVPLIIHVRKTGKAAGSALGRTISRHGSKINFAVFLAIVIVLGAMPFGPMVLDFSPQTSGGDATASTITADLECTEAGDLVECEVTDERGFDHVVVVGVDGEIETIHDPPYRFEIDPDEHDRFGVELRDADGNVLKRFVERF